MARELTDGTNVNAPGAPYPFGRTRDTAGAIEGTVVNEALIGDVLVTFQKLAALAGVTLNSLPDNDTNGYQLVEAISKAVLVNKNTYGVQTIDLGADDVTNGDYRDVLESSLTLKGTPLFFYWIDTSTVDTLYLVTKWFYDNSTYRIFNNSGGTITNAKIKIIS